MRRTCVVAQPSLHLLLVALLLGAACAEPECPPSPIRLPSIEQSLTWAVPSLPIVSAHIGTRPVELLLDTGFPQSAITPEAAEGHQPARLEIDVGGAHLGPLTAGFLLADFGIDGIVGAESLHRLPHRHDARAMTTTFLPAFSPPGNDGVALELIAAQTCRSGREELGPGGPWAMLVRGEIEGHPATFLIDTGAGATFIRTSLFERLTDRATLSGIRVGSGFAGEFPGTASRAKSLSVGNASSPNALVLAAAPVDAQLDRLGTELTPHSAQRSTRDIVIDGLLGWSFLREFEVSLAHGASATEARSLGLQRFDSQSHWTREFVGIGILRSPSAIPEGIRVDGFLSQSPARDAGLLAGDVIVKVDDFPVQGTTPLSFMGSARLEVQRNVGSEDEPRWEPRTFEVVSVDLLPDPL